MSGADQDLANTGCQRLAVTSKARSKLFVGSLLLPRYQDSAEFLDVRVISFGQLNFFDLPTAEKHPSIVDGEVAPFAHVVAQVLG